MATTESAAYQSVYRNINLGTTGAVVKASPGVVSGWYIGNSDTIGTFVKLYDQTTVPTGADTPKLTLNLPAQSAANVMTGDGILFTSGIAVRASSLVADNDATAPLASSLTLNLLYS